MVGGGYRQILFDELEVFKHFNGFDPRYLSHNFYLPLIARRLNNYHYTKFFEDKGLFGCFSSEIAAPKCIVRCIDGEYYDNRLEQLSRGEAERACLDFGGDIIIKPSRESSGGQRVTKFTPLQRTEPGWFEKTAQSYGNDWVAQECITQHEALAMFNPESVNTFRITSLYLNGKASICSSVLRFGNFGSVTDNLGAGGKMIGVCEDGKLREFAVNLKAERFYEVNGTKFTEMCLPFMPELHELILRAHVKDFSLCKLIGWDVCVEKDGKPVIIEVNSSQPGIFAEQICCGPIFGDRTEEVIEYVNSKEFKYNKGLIYY